MKTENRKLQPFPPSSPGLRAQQVFNAHSSTAAATAATAGSAARAASGFVVTTHPSISQQQECVCRLSIY